MRGVNETGEGVRLCTPAARRADDHRYPLADSPRLPAYTSVIRNASRSPRLPRCCRIPSSSASGRSLLRRRANTRRFARTNPRERLHLSEGTPTDRACTPLLGLRIRTTRGKLLSESLRARLGPATAFLKRPELPWNAPRQADSSGQGR